MTPASLPAPRLPGVEILQGTRISGPPLTPVQTAGAAVFLLLLLWVAYRIGKMVLRVVAGLLFLGLLGGGIWYLFIK